MQFRQFQFFRAIAIFLLAGLASAETGDPDTCFKQGNKQCLEQIFKDIYTNPAPEKSNAVYLLGLLFLEEGNYEDAKYQFEMGIRVGDAPRSKEKLVELLTSGNIDLSVFDCKVVGTEECFLKVLKNNPGKAGDTYYHLALAIGKTDIEKATEYTIKSADLGNRSSQCLLSHGYAKNMSGGGIEVAGFLPSLPEDYEKSRQLGIECGIGPFEGYRKEHFEKYISAEGHKAYAKFGRRYRIFDYGLATQELATRVTGEMCRRGSKNKEQVGDKCLIVDVDGEWVDYFVAEPLPERVGGLEDLLHLSARASYKKYEEISVPKVFVQGALGNWAWWPRKSDESIEELTQLAVEACHENWRFKKLNSVCEVVNINGKWVK